MAQTTNTKDEIAVLEISRDQATFALVGETPLIFNAMSEKARRELLFPSGGRKTAASRAAALKHEPLIEYRDSVYRDRSPNGLTRLNFPAPAFKGALCTAALDIPGVTKAAIERLSWCRGYRLPIYGVPQLSMMVVRSADMAKTPDIRTRAILPRWACIVTIAFVTPRLTGVAIGRLMAAAGITCGIGDYRQEKGKGDFGRYRIVDENDQELAEIIETGGRTAQDAALEIPEFFDAETEALYHWFENEVPRRRDRKPALVNQEAA